MSAPRPKRIALTTRLGLSPSKDIVAICTDGASVMRKVGGLLEAEQQLCYAHGIQLAVLDVLYKSKYNKRMDSDDAGVSSHTDRQASDGDDYGESQMLDEDQNQMECEEECEDPEGELDTDLYLEVLYLETYLLKCSSLVTVYFPSYLQKGN